MRNIEPQAIDELRERIEKIEGFAARRRQVLPFGVPEIDDRIPGGGLSLNGIHEFAGGGLGTIMPSVPTMFLAGILARLKGSVIWCLEKNDVFAPGLAQAGLHPDRVIYVESDNADDVLANTEEALRFGGLAAVVAEVPKFENVVSRRLQLAAEKSGVPGMIIRKWRRMENARDFGNPSCALTRWRISPIPSAPLPVPGVGPMRWIVELMRARGGQGADWKVEACDGQGRIALVRQDEKGLRNYG
jgi:protein ImuA